MPTITFTGKVLPSSLRIDISELPPFTSKEFAGGELVTIVITVINSAISAKCTTEHALGNDISILHTRATHVVRSVLDCFAFAHGLGLIVFLDEMVDVDGSTKKIRIMNEHLGQYFTAFRKADESLDFDDFYRLVVVDPDLSLAINDLVLAVTTPGNIALGCGRAIEALRSIFLPGDVNRKQAWMLLREALQLDRSYTELISRASTGPRHGADRYLPTDEDQQEVLVRSWVIMNRFLEYRKRGNLPLSPREFPILK